MITGTEWLEIAHYDFFWRALIAAALSGLLCGFIGPYLAWKNLGLFGATLSHAALFPIAVGIVIGISAEALLYPFVMLLALLIAYFKKKSFVGLDSYLAIFYSGFMALGILLLSYKGQGSNEMIHYLFGEILIVSSLDILVLLILLSSVMLFTLWQKKALLLNIIQSEIASVEIKHINAIHYSSYLIIGLCIAASIKIMGIVLITSLLMVPTIMASRFTNKLRHHIYFCLLAGFSFAVGGIFFSIAFNMPSGASIASLAICSFFISCLLPAKK